MVRDEGVGEVGALGVEGDVRERGAAHVPFVDEGVEGFGRDARLADAAAGEAFGDEVAVGGGEAGVAEPDLRGLPARGLAGGERGAEERPLDAEGRAVGAFEGGGDVPPFDAEVGVGAVVLREFEAVGGVGEGEAGGLGAHAVEALGGGGGGEEGTKRSRDKKSHGVHGQRPTRGVGA